jgi:F-type H+-transporting ATPase subunit delta
LTVAQQNAVTASLVRRYGSGLNFLFSHNPALLGGLRVKMGSDVYDDSVLARLNALHESF